MNNTINKLTRQINACRALYNHFWELATAHPEAAHMYNDLANSYIAKQQKLDRLLKQEQLAAITADLNPLIVLIGSTLRSGHPMFARELLELLPVDLETLMPGHGFNAASVAYVVSQHVEHSASGAL